MKLDRTYQALQGQARSLAESLGKDALDCMVLWSDALDRIAGSIVESLLARILIYTQPRRLNIGDATASSALKWTTNLI
jgi:hypothetical protein